MRHFENTITYDTVTPQEFVKDIKSSQVFLLDVRTSEEYNAGHLEGAANADVLNPDFVENAEKIMPQDKTIAVYCGTGKRSGMAAEALAEQGFKVINLDGGLDALKAAGLWR